MSRGIYDQLSEMDDLGTVWTGTGYDWAQLDMYYDRKARIFRWYSSCGCSCSSMSDDYNSMTSLDEMEFGRKDEAIRAVQRYIEGEDQTSRDEGQQVIQAIKASRGELEEKFIRAGNNPNLAEGVL